MARSIVGAWNWFKRTQTGTRMTEACSTDKNVTFYANGRYEYIASTICPNMPAEVDPTTHITGTYRVVGNTIVGRADNGQSASFSIRLLQGGQILKIGGDQFIRK